MVFFILIVSALLGVGIAALLFAGPPDPAPPVIYMAAAGASGWAGTWLYSRWKHGKGVTVTPSRPKDWQP